MKLQPLSIVCYYYPLDNVQTKSCWITKTFSFEKKKEKRLSFEITYFFIDFIQFFHCTLNSWKLSGKFSSITDAKDCETLIHFGYITCSHWNVFGQTAVEWKECVKISCKNKNSIWIREILYTLNKLQNNINNKWTNKNSNSI